MLQKAARTAENERMFPPACTNYGRGVCARRKRKLENPFSYLERKFNGTKKNRYTVRKAVLEPCD